MFSKELAMGAKSLLKYQLDLLKDESQVPVLEMEKQQYREKNEC